MLGPKIFDTKLKMEKKLKTATKIRYKQTISEPEMKILLEKEQNEIPNKVKKEMCDMPNSISQQSSIVPKPKRLRQEVEASVKKEIDDLHCVQQYTKTNRKQPLKRTFSRFKLKTLLVKQVEKQYQCSKCGRSFSLLSSRNCHTVCCFEDFNLCSYCGRTFVTKYQFLCHYVRYHVVINQNDFLKDILDECENQVPIPCPNKFTQQGDTETVYVQDNELFKCGVCSNTYRYKHTLKAHMVMHTDQNELTCKICSRRYRFKHTLKAHMLIHTGEKPFRCKICSKKFTDGDSLKRHVILHPDVKCAICSKNFSRKENLKTHMLVHTREKLFKCKICSRSFGRKDSLVKHMFLHTSEKPFYCAICSMSFAKKCTLKDHMHVHVDERRFKCEICHRKFAEKRGLTSHNKRMHVKD